MKKRNKVHLLIKSCAFIFIAITSLNSCSPPENQQITATRLLNRPLIGPEIDPSIGINIQGPSLVRVPEWVPGRLGKYYLYFADHKGSYIRLAYADELLGPWQVYVPGSLQIEQSFFLSEPAEITEDQLNQMVEERQTDWVALSHDWRTELTTPHIASPDVHIDEDNKLFIMYYHGLDGPGAQLTRVATSPDGINFTAQQQNLGRTYMRVFKHAGMTYSMAMPGQFYRSADGFTNFEAGPALFNRDMRHAALLKEGNLLSVFWTQVGDAPELIKLSTIDLSGDWMTWKESSSIEILRPEYSWEGADAPIEPSVRSSAYGLVNQLRDPSIFKDEEKTYLLYTVGGESGIAIAELQM